MRLLCNTLLRFCFSAGVLFFSAVYHAAGADTTFVRPVRNEWLRAAKELARRIQAMAADEQVVRLYISDSGVLENVRSIGAGDYDKLQKVTVAEIPRPKLMAGFLNRSFAASDADTAVYRRLAGIMENRITPFVIVTALNGYEGSTHLAAGAVLADSRTYIQPQDWREDLLLVLEYGGEYAVAVAFWQSGENTVTGHATFIPSERTEMLFLSLGEFCGEHIPIRHLSGEELNKPSL